MRLEDWLNGEILGIIRGNFDKKCMDGLHVIDTKQLDKIRKADNCGECRFYNEVHIADDGYGLCEKKIQEGKGVGINFGCINFKQKEGS